MNFIDKSQLSDKELIIFNQEVEANKKSPVVSYLLWWFTGVVGGHRYYFGKTASAITMTLIFFPFDMVLGIRSYYNRLLGNDRCLFYKQLVKRR